MTKDQEVQYYKAHCFAFWQTTYGGSEVTHSYALFKRVVTITVTCVAICNYKYFASVSSLSSPFSKHLAVIFLQFRSKCEFPV